MTKNYIKKQLAKINNRICELLENTDLHENKNYNTSLEKACRKYDYYDNLLKIFN
jgi:hypothetical protein